MTAAWIAVDSVPGSGDALPDVWSRHPDGAVGTTGGCLPHARLRGNTIRAPEAKAGCDIEADF